MKIHRTSSQIFNVDICLPILSLLSTVPVCHFAEAKKLGSAESRVKKNIPNPSVQRQKNLSRDGKISGPQRHENLKFAEAGKRAWAINLTRRINCRLEI
jgi:hypothetical protein